jgi:hypothetical protein
VRGEDAAAGVEALGNASLLTEPAHRAARRRSRAAHTPTGRTR